MRLSSSLRCGDSPEKGNEFQHVALLVESAEVGGQLFFGWTKTFDFENEAFEFGCAVILGGSEHFFDEWLWDVNRVFREQPRRVLGMRFEGDF